MFLGITLKELFFAKGKHFRFFLKYAYNIHSESEQPKTKDNQEKTSIKILNAQQIKTINQ